ncbi:zinc ABC transporter substrate-binding protein [Hoeflea sp.]|uniref:zinc ABC transporter substrate-binding protein n=1 Tax=Hoeflea sp. TaxID=1940281 RepID=UPI00198CAB0F|nr:zinc ABC transporter substrate-binding protein [Hoeflea sp.]MBC7283533.1 zinc ABC transporter substrate-binding protein [Hoeflea sp.]
MTKLRQFSCSAALSLALLPALAAQGLAAPKVVASIKPVHSLVAAVMQGVAEPELIVSGAASPHSYALKPSQAEALESADLVFWVGHELETFLEKPIETIASKARAVELIDAAGLVTLPLREGGAFEPHMHDDHENDQAGENGHSETEGHDHADAGEHEHAEDEEHDHAHDGFDAHVWLDPLNAKAFVSAIAEALSEADPANAAAYATNADAELGRLDVLISEVNASLAPVRDKNYIVFHDAYQYFEKRFDIEAAGSITVNPEIKPSAERLALIQAKVKDLDAVCAFSEPQFESRLVAVAIEGSNAQTAVLDPLGAGLDDGPELYGALIRGLATSMKQCLETAS